VKLTEFYSSVVVPQLAASGPENLIILKGKRKNYVVSAYRTNVVLIARILFVVALLFISMQLFKVCYIIVIKPVRP